MENAPLRLGYLNTYFLLGGTVWGRFRRCDLAGEDTSLGQALRFFNHILIPIFSPYFVLVVKPVIS